MKIKIYYGEVDPALESTEFDLNSVKVKGNCIIGRAPECGLVLDGADLSRQHAKFSIEDGNYYFADLGSRNGSLFNGELAQANREYLLNPDDTIRIGDFILKVEQEAEMAATVFKVIDPSFFKSAQPQVETISQPEALGSPTPETDESSDRVRPSPIIIVDNSIAKDLPDRVVEEHPKSDLAIDRPNDENILNRVVEEHPGSVADPDDSNEDNVLDRITEEESAPALAVDKPHENILDRVTEDRPSLDLVSDESNRENILDRVLEEHPIAARANDEIDNENILDRVSQEFPLPTLDNNDEWDEEEDVIDNLVPATQPSLGLTANDELEEEEDTSEAEEQEQPSLGLTSDRVRTDIIGNTDTKVQPSLDLMADESDEEDIAEPEIDEQSPPTLTINELDEESTPTSEIEEQPSLVPVAAAAAIVSGVEIDNNKIGAELLTTKQIVLIAHDSKIADLTDIVDRHKEFLSKCLTISWSSIADSLKQETGMAVSKEISSGASGGYQTIAGLVNSGDILAVIFLKDFFAPAQTGQANEEALLRLCNINEIMLATNIATADAIVNYLQS
jgi:methylglyoxal synthase